jgi:hypothetical protein
VATSENEGTMAVLPQLSKTAQRKLKVQWDTLLDKHNLTPEHVAQYDRNRNNLLKAASRGIEPLWAQAPQVVSNLSPDPSTKLAEGRFRSFDGEYWLDWCSRGAQYEIYRDWLDILKLQILEELASIWKGRSAATDHWFEESCRPTAEKALTTLANQRIAQARADEIERLELAAVGRQSAGGLRVSTDHTVEEESRSVAAPTESDNTLPKGGTSIPGIAKGAMDKPNTPKTAWPLRVQEIKQRTMTLLEDCARKGEPYGLLLNTDRVTEIMRSGAAESFRAIVEYCESQPGFLPEQFDEVADETVTATLGLAPIHFFRSSRYKESVPAIREALKSELHAVLRQRKERAGALSDLGGVMGHSEDTSTASVAGPAVNAGKSEGKGRRYGPPTDYETAARAKKIVDRIAGKERWRSRVEDICDELDKKEVPRPKTWKAKGYGFWSTCAERHLVVEAIRHHLDNAKKQPPLES